MLSLHLCVVGVAPDPDIHAGGLGFRGGPEEPRKVRSLKLPGWRRGPTVQKEAEPLLEAERAINKDRVAGTLFKVTC